MHEIPDCLSHRYRALDEVIKELSQNSMLESQGEVNSAGIKLMCDFWKILKEDPDCNLTQEVRMRMGITPTPTVETRQNDFGRQRYMAYMAGTDEEGPPKKSCRESESEPKKKPHKEKKVCCSSKSEDFPLTKVLCNLDEASDFDQKCHVRVKHLQKAQDELSVQIDILESREKDGVELLKKADAIWMTMENAYKEKLSQSAERQKELIKQLKEVEESSSKWRKNRKDLEFQIQNMNKAKIEIAETMNQKKNDLKIMESDIANLEKRIDSNRKDLDNSKNSMSSKREKSDAKLSQLANEIAMAQKKTKEERIHKKNKIEEGTQYVREAREDLQKICKTYLQKKLENEDLIAEEKALHEEMALLQTTAEACKEKCQKKAIGVNEEIKKLTEEMAAFEVQCIQCHVCTDTNDSRKICTDCPRCAKSDCVIKDGYCTSDPAMDCVCMSVKQKFLDNVFDNMYTVLARQSKTRSGKAVANAVVKCLRKSRNGKLDQDTRNILQEFILNTVKRNLNLTIVGGAVKTRCEMEPETYKQLMLCLKNVKAVAKKEDKGTVAKKDPCKRWGDETECHCPKGPKDCICMKKAPRPPNDPTPCPDEVMGPIDDEGSSIIHEGRQCDMSGWRRAPCAGASCSYAKNMRAAQCVLGPEKLKQLCTGFNVINDVSEVDDLVDCNCRKISCSYCQDMCGHPRQRIIEEVMGRIDEVEPVAKVDSMRRQRRIQRNISRSDATYTKHLKARVIRYRDKSTPAEPNQTPVNEVRFKLPCIISQQSEVRYIPTTQSNISTISHKQQNHDNNIREVQTSLDDIFMSHINIPSLETDFDAKQFEIKISVTDGQLGNQFTKLVKTDSGRLAMDLDQSIIDILEQKTQRSQFLFITPKETESGHLVMQFNSKEDITHNHRIRINMTPSGTRLLEMHKDLIKLIKNDKTSKCTSCNSSFGSIKQWTPSKGTLISENVKTFLKGIENIGIPDKNSSSKQDKYLVRLSSPMNSSESMDFLFFPVKSGLIDKKTSTNELSGLHKDNDNNQYEIEESEFEYTQDKTTSISCIPEISMPINQKNIYDYCHEFQQLYETGNVFIVVQVKTKNGMDYKFRTVVTKSPSGVIGADLIKFASLAWIAFDESEFPVCLLKSKSGTYLINTDKSDQDLCNAVLIKTVSGYFKLVPKNILHKKDFVERKVHKDYDKIKIVGYQNYPIEFSAVLKPTLSSNYDIILDNELENYLKQTPKQYIPEENQCFVFMTKTHSGHTIDFNTSGSIPSKELNALLVKSKSGHVKLLVHGPIFENAMKSKQCSLNSAKLLNELLRSLKLSIVSTDKVVNKLVNTGLVSNLKASSDTQLLKNTKVELQVSKNLSVRPSSIIKKTESNQYTLVLNKESKRTLINNISGYLNSDLKKSVKASKSGEILITINRDGQKNIERQWVKITPSGNIYVNVDIQNIKMAPKKNKISNKSNAESLDLMVLVNKAVTTSCNGMPEDCDCDVSKCVCSELEFRTVVDCFNLSKVKRDIGKSNRDIDKTCDNTSCEHLSNRIKQQSATHADQKFGCTEQCYYVVDAICPPCIYRYRSLSYDVEEISSYSNDEQCSIKAFSEEGTCHNNSKMLNSIEYLPHQLPLFLDDIVYEKHK